MPLTPHRSFHPWHDIPTGPNPPSDVTAVIEIPTNERNKYELDKESGLFRLDRVLHSAVHCTVNVVLLRFYLYLVSTAAVWYMAARALIQHFGAS